MQTTRQWMIPQDWMVKGNHQTEWIDRRGILLWLAFYAGGLGGGLYLVSLFFNNIWGMLIGWFIAAGLKGAFHFIYLGQPARFWRLVMHPQTSWLSRGLLFVIFFTGFGFIQIMLSWFLPDQTVIILIFEIIAGMLALSVATYTGFVLNNVKGVPFWDLSLLPVLFVACGILGGFGLTVAIAIFSPGVNMEAAEIGLRVLLVINVLLIAVYLFQASRKETAGRQSVLLQIRGGLSPIFWICVVALGIVIPATITVYSLFSGEATSAILIIGAVCEIIGGVMLRYCVLKSGIYNPLIPKKATRQKVKKER
jgi:formate-dependent nitrite reductase membrane component NrfD